MGGGRRELVLDPDRQLVLSGGRRAHLTPLEYDVLHALLVEPGRVRDYAELTEQVWGTRHVGEAAQVHSVVKRVRRKLDRIASPVQVQVVHGVGFRAVVQPVAAPTDESGHDQVKGQ
ncbi:winged helix-turn-helix transcriptional regulator [Ornithinimicrobium pratense]|uniref:Winged helix-turn-helix transcriptional regulator n=1 Tax=Ornithinimicrobium pratense TaxID=2593973 RepID=A0A5J6V6Y7_9MICO|nr:winged helix-turn-helix transcriptional regulator [Ornithinimicrobium pratense]